MNAQGQQPVVPASLRAAVLARFRSIHAFCAAHPELARATVYMVLGGRYPGKTTGQAAKIWAVLAGLPGGEEGAPAPCLAPGLTQNETAITLQAIRCSHCRRLDKRGCTECRTQTEREARELYAKLFPGR